MKLWLRLHLTLPFPSRKSEVMLINSTNRGLTNKDGILRGSYCTRYRDVGTYSVLTGNVHLNAICVTDRRRRHTGPSASLSDHLAIYQLIEITAQFSCTNNWFRHGITVQPQMYSSRKAISNQKEDVVPAIGHIY